MSAPKTSEASPTPAALIRCTDLLALRWWLLLLIAFVGLWIVESAP
jgi:hypothetical protein